MFMFQSSPKCYIRQPSNPQLLMINSFLCNLPEMFPMELF